MISGGIIMLERIQNVFVRVTGITDFVITANTRLTNKDIALSSFTLIQLFCELEDEFNIEISNAAIKRMKTVGEILNYLEKHGCA